MIAYTFTLEVTSCPHCGADLVEGKSLKVNYETGYYVGEDGFIEENEDQQLCLDEPFPTVTCANCNNGLDASPMPEEV
jgi:ribosomal protein S27E